MPSGRDRRTGRAERPPGSADDNDSTEREAERVVEGNLYKVSLPVAKSVCVEREGNAF